MLYAGKDTLFSLSLAYQRSHVVSCLRQIAEQVSKMTNAFLLRQVKGKVGFTLRMFFFFFNCICNLTSHYKLFVTWQQSNYTGYACNFDVSIKIPTLWRTAYGTFRMSRRTKVNRSGGIGGVDPACRTVTSIKYLINEQITWTIQKQRFGCSQYVSHSVSYFESQMCLTVFSYLAWLLGNKTKSGFFSPWSFPLLLCFVEWLGAFMFGRGRLKVI